MKTIVKQLLCLCCAALLLCGSLAFASGESSSDASAETREVVYPETAAEYIENAISCKNFSDEEVSDEILADIVAAGIQAPSAMNSQPWQFIIVKDADLKDALVSGAPAVVIVAVPEEDYTMGGDSQFAAGTAAEAMYLYAQSIGLGAHMYTAPVAMVLSTDEAEAEYGSADGYEAAVVLAFGYYADYPDSFTGATVRSDYDSFVTVIG